jgi:hypothetical protein
MDGGIGPESGKTEGVVPGEKGVGSGEMGAEGRLSL